MGRSVRSLYSNSQRVSTFRWHPFRWRILTLLSNRLKRIYILFNAKHGLNEADKQMVAHLSQSLVTEQGTQPFTLQAIITKADTIPIANLEEVIGKIKKDIWEAAPLCLPPIVTSAEMRPPFGVDLVRQNIAQACGL